MKKFTIFQLLAIPMFFVYIFSFCIGYALCESKSGNIIWDKTFGRSENDVAFSIIQTKDGGYAVSGYTRLKGKGKTDAWVIKLDEQGNTKWDKTIGGSYCDSTLSIIQTKDGDYIAAGWTMSKGAGGADAWVIKLEEK